MKRAAQVVKDLPVAVDFTFSTRIVSFAKMLADYGFTAQDGSWILEKDGYSLKVTFREEETESGVLRTYDISGIEGENTLLTLPATRFIPKEVSP